jgi:hypothetical protein
MAADQVSARQIEFVLFSSFQARESIVLEETTNPSCNALEDHTYQQSTTSDTCLNASFRFHSAYRVQ